MTLFVGLILVVFVSHFVHNGSAVAFNSDSRHVELYEWSVVEVDERSHSRPAARANLACAVVGNYLYVSGGILPNGMATRAFDRVEFKLPLQPYHPPLRLEDSDDPVPVIAGHSMSVLDNRLFIFGGLVTLESVPSNDTYVVDPSSPSWVMKKLEVESNGEVPLPRHGHAAAEWKDDLSILIFGGVHESERLNDLHRFDPTRSPPRWTRIQLNKAYGGGDVDELPGLEGSAMIVMNQQAFIFGGLNNDGVMNTDVFAIDLVKSEWRVVSSMQEIRRRAYFTATVVAESVYLVGGVTSAGEYLSDVQVLDLNRLVLGVVASGRIEVNETSSAVTLGPRQGHCAVVYWGDVYVHGGSSKTALLDDIVKLRTPASREDLNGSRCQSALVLNLDVDAQCLELDIDQTEADFQSLLDTYNILQKKYKQILNLTSNLEWEDPDGVRDLIDSWVSESWNWTMLNATIRDHIDDLETANRFKEPVEEAKAVFNNASDNFTAWLDSERGRLNGLDDLLKLIHSEYEELLEVRQNETEKVGQIEHDYERVSLLGERLGNYNCWLGDPNPENLAEAYGIEMTFPVGFDCEEIEIEPEIDPDADPDADADADPDAELDELLERPYQRFEKCTFRHELHRLNLTDHPEVEEVVLICNRTARGNRTLLADLERELEKMKLERAELFAQLEEIAESCRGGRCREYSEYLAVLAREVVSKTEYVKEHLKDLRDVHRLTLLLSELRVDFHRARGPLEAMYITNRQIDHYVKRISEYMIDSKSSEKLAEMRRKCELTGGNCVIDVKPLLDMMSGEIRQKYSDLASEEMDVEGELVVWAREVMSSYAKLRYQSLRQPRMGRQRLDQLATLIQDYTDKILRLKALITSLEGKRKGAIDNIRRTLYFVNRYCNELVALKEREIELNETMTTVRIQDLQNNTHDLSASRSDIEVALDDLQLKKNDFLQHTGRYRFMTKEMTAKTDELFQNLTAFRQLNCEEFADHEICPYECQTWTIADANDSSEKKYKCCHCFFLRDTMPADCADNCSLCNVDDWEEVWSNRSAIWRAQGTTYHGSCPHDKTQGVMFAFARDVSPETDKGLGEHFCTTLRTSQEIFQEWKHFVETCDMRMKRYQARVRGAADAMANMFEPLDDLELWMKHHLTFRDLALHSSLLWETAPTLELLAGKVNLRFDALEWMVGDLRDEIDQLADLRAGFREKYSIHKAADDALRDATNNYMNVSKVAAVKQNAFTLASDELLGLRNKLLHLQSELKSTQDLIPIIKGRIFRTPDVKGECEFARMESVRAEAEALSKEVDLLYIDSLVTNRNLANLREPAIEILDRLIASLNVSDADARARLDDIRERMEALGLGTHRDMTGCFSPEDLISRIVAVKDHVNSVSSTCSTTSCWLRNLVVILGRFCDGINDAEPLNSWICPFKDVSGKDDITAFFKDRKASLEEKLNETEAHVVNVTQQIEDIKVLIEEKADEKETLKTELGVLEADESVWNRTRVERRDKMLATFGDYLDAYTGVLRFILQTSLKIKDVKHTALTVVLGVVDRANEGLSEYEKSRKAFEEQLKNSTDDVYNIRAMYKTNCQKMAKKYHGTNLEKTAHEAAEDELLDCDEIVPIVEPDEEDLSEANATDAEAENLEDVENLEDAENLLAVDAESLEKVEKEDAENLEDEPELDLEPEPEPDPERFDLSREHGSEGLVS